MAAPIDQRLLFLLGTYLYEILEDDDEVIYHLIVNENETIAGNNRRQNVPRIFGYFEEILPRFLTEDYRTHFRVSKEMFEKMLRELMDSLTLVHRGGREQVTPAKQLFIFLCYMANTESMREIGQYFGVGKSTVHVTLERVAEAFMEKFLRVIKWPDFNTQEQIAQDLQLRYGLPDIVGYLDGTHIRLSGCPRGDRDYINRKSYPSIQLQIVVDQNLLITNCYSGWAGCAHDARVLRNSSLYEKAEAGGYIVPGKVIVADSAYPLKDWLITPFKDNGHLTRNQRRFNRVLSSGRQTVERTIGHLKGRFRRLREITVHEPLLIVSLIICGCILHNLCILNHENLDAYINDDDDDGNHPNRFQNIFQNDVSGIARRQTLMNSMY